jgi:uncharacterized RDD family membrane protein YckC
MCDYIGFEAADRCRNCGYDFARPASDTPPADLAVVDRGPEGALQDMPMRSGAADRAVTREPDIDKVLQNLDRVLGDSRGADLPLFGDEEPPLAPLVDASGAPRRPLSVRRATPDPARLRPKPVRHVQAPQALELPLPSADEPSDAPPRRVPPPIDAEATAAPPLLRVLAAVLDLLLLGGIDVLVVYFTLRMCGLTTDQIGMLPVVPLAAFFLLVNGGYLAAFTAAGGQTIGKMAFGLRVVGNADLPVSGGFAVVRALGCVASVASLGLGFLPAVLADGGRALEDRLAHTRVVRVTA